MYIWSRHRSPTFNDGRRFEGNSFGKGDTLGIQPDFMNVMDTIHGKVDDERIEGFVFNKANTVARYWGRFQGGGSGKGGSLSHHRGELL